eukprot:scaffold657202_cov59-Prasinocladus_malaysianus.AAC.1
MQPIQSFVDVCYKSLPSSSITGRGRCIKNGDFVVYFYQGNIAGPTINGGYDVDPCVPTASPTV